MASAALMLATAAAKVGLTHDRAVMIGDSGGDVVMGRAYGAITIWCAWGYARAITEHPDHVARTPDELAGIVQDAISSVSTSRRIGRFSNREHSTV